MNFQVCPQIYASKDLMTFKFERQGLEGRKAWHAVQFSKLGPPGYYNIAMGELRDEGVPDTAETATNSDIEIIVAALGAIAFAWLERFPKRVLLFLGQDQIHNRLYRMAVNRALHLIAPLFEIRVFQETGDGGLKITQFDPAVDCIAFVVLPKSANQLAKPPPKLESTAVDRRNIVAVFLQCFVKLELWRMKKEICKRIIPGQKFSSNVGRMCRPPRRNRYFPKSLSKQNCCWHV